MIGLINTMDQPGKFRLSQASSDYSRSYATETLKPSLSNTITIRPCRKESTGYRKWNRRSLIMAPHLFHTLPGIHSFGWYLKAINLFISVDKKTSADFPHCVIHDNIILVNNYYLHSNVEELKYGAWKRWSMDFLAQSLAASLHCFIHCFWLQRQFIWIMNYYDHACDTLKMKNTELYLPCCGISWK